MKNTFVQYRALCQDRQYLRDLMIGWMLLITSFVVMHYAGLYATSMAGASVSDLFLDHLPLWDVNVLHIHAALIFWLVFIAYLFTQPQWLPFVTKTTAVFIFARSVFICMTHLGPPENLLSIPPHLASYVLFDGDLFFSGHVGGPCLMLMIFWRHRLLRVICLCAAVFFSIIVLLGHIHYSIDVFSAPFITFGLYQFCYHRFKTERSYCQQGTLSIANNAAQKTHIF